MTSLYPRFEPFDNNDDMALMDLSNLYPESKPSAKDLSPRRTRRISESSSPFFRQLYPSVHSLPPDLTVEDILASALRTTHGHTSTSPSSPPRMPVTATHKEVTDDEASLNESFQLRSKDSGSIPPSISIPSSPTCTARHSQDDQQNASLRLQEPSRTNGIQIEVSPGEYLPLRSSDETVWAVESGTARDVSCFNCQAVLTTVPDCQAVICPDCRMVSPVDQFEEEQDLWAVPGGPDLHQSMPTILRGGSFSDHSDDPFALQQQSSVSHGMARRGVGLGLLKRGRSSVR